MRLFCYNRLRRTITTFRTLNLKLGFIRVSNTLKGYFYTPFRVLKSISFLRELQILHQEKKSNDQHNAQFNVCL